MLPHQIEPNTYIILVIKWLINIHKTLLNINNYSLYRKHHIKNCELIGCLVVVINHQKMDQIKIQDHQYIGSLIIESTQRFWKYILFGVTCNNQTSWHPMHVGSVELGQTTCKTRPEHREKAYDVLSGRSGLEPACLYTMAELGEGALGFPSYKGGQQPTSDDHPCVRVQDFEKL